MKYELMIIARETGDEPESKPVSYLSTCIATANDLYNEAERNAEIAIRTSRLALISGLKLGCLLTCIKQETPHGEFTSFFADAPKSLKIKSAKRTHECVLNFASKTARQYMACYKKALAKLKTTDRQILETQLSAGEGLTELGLTLIEKASNGAETLRQAMIYWGVTKRNGTLTKSAETDDETDDDWRNKNGGPKKSDLTPEQKLESAKEASTTAWSSLCFELHQLLTSGRHLLVSPPIYKETRNVLIQLLAEMDETFRLGKFK